MPPATLFCQFAEDLAGARTAFSHEHLTRRDDISSHHIDLWIVGLDMPAVVSIEFTVAYILQNAHYKCAPVT